MAAALRLIRRLSLLGACIALAACAATSAAAGADAAEEGGDEPSLASLERALEAAKGDLLQADVELRTQHEENEAAGSAARREHEEALRRAAEWSGREAPLERAKAALEVEAAEMALAEQTEELAQLELMYAEQDLADQTRELVLARTKRRIAQSRKELEIAREELATLTEVTHPARRRELELEAAGKEREAASAMRAGRVEAGQKQVAKLKAEHAVADAAEALAKAKEAGAGGEE